MPRDVYACFGDSITVGRDASHPSLTFVARVTSALGGKGRQYKPLVIAGTGWTTRQLLEAVRRLPTARWSTIDVLSLMIGGNDLRRRYYAAIAQPDAAAVLAPALKEYRHGLNAICDIVSEHGIRNVFLHTVYNPLPNSPLCVVAFRELNDIIRSCAEQRNYDVVDVHAAFVGREPEYIYRYRTGRLEDLVFPFNRPIHPNDRGHEAIANLVVRSIKSRLSRPSKGGNTSVTASAVRRKKRFTKRQTSVR